MVKNEMRQFWLQSFAFWEQSVSFKQKIDRMDLLPFGCKVCLLVAKCLLQTENGQNRLKNLFEVREMANSLYSLVLKISWRTLEMVAMELPFRNLRISLE